MRDQRATDHLIAGLAERQGGVVEHGQLVALGLSPAAIHRRVRGGRLHPWYRGVYAVGHRSVGTEGRWWAAVWAYAPDAVLSHTTAGVAWEVLRSNAGTIHVTVGLGGKFATSMAARRAVVEADSYRWDRSPSALNEDRERDVLLTLAGYRVLRFTWEQVTKRPRYVVQAIVATPVRSSSPTPPG
jgi:hypothetical protein